ncbi:uncharacterized protein FOMMEDRAFT_111686 [Fomitiporia mediterranea MF3/22]|uniref:uncharacterized protein n=1 Tax=Fomitiporia mediterranea (strain MF3/22) TaxID=694068 RepID=UPI0004407902|nr:uncharacterized protein FOMMEDRAFT_111686 [Fomitiporia mediterranea MF3/22]EJD01685.1 hypothetical protein FOMMEDRAFT_111686 [Fomitiporia mediterranea MF3/22]
MPPPYHGSCLCGKVEFEVNTEPMVTVCCHCKNCKKYTGTVFSTSVLFPANNPITITKGENFIGTFNDTSQDSSNELSRKFCSLCGSSLYNEGGGDGHQVAVLYSALDDFNVTIGDGITEEVKPQLEVYTKDRTSWVHPVEGAQQSKTRPGKDQFADVGIRS